MDRNKVPNVHPIVPSNVSEGNIHVNIGKTSIAVERIEEKSEWRQENEIIPEKPTMCSKWYKQESRKDGA